jgi:hypothetical protein
VALGVTITFGKADLLFGSGRLLYQTMGRIPFLVHQIAISHKGAGNMKEKTRVKQGLQTPLVLDEVWQPIATAWFDKWKAYVNYDVVADVQVSRFP